MSPPPPEAKFSVGGITERSLAYYNGRDWAKPLLLAVKGVVYDVTDAMDTFGPGAAAGSSGAGGGCWGCRAPGWRAAVGGGRPPAARRLPLSPLRPTRR
jgi:hypothetical protein